MSQSSSKQVMSGLGSVTRDFSSNNLPRSQDRMDAAQPPRLSSQPTAEQRERRMKAIEAALGTTRDAESASAPSQKRPSPSEEGPPKKRRQLPSSWGESKSTQNTALHGRASKKSSGGGPSRSAGTNPAAKVALSQEQKHILGLVEARHSVFYTGSAGTGKSVLLREIIARLKHLYSGVPDAVAVTASTGIAACNVGGVTIHSFAGIGLGIEDAEHLASKIRKNAKAMARWQRTKVLIIDEVSMVDGKLFDKLAAIGSSLRKRPEPFGGIQLIVTGDFFQLPPVTKGGDVSVTFAFEAEQWNNTIKHTFNLTKVFRQTDPEFVDMLNEMRFGKLSPKSIARFKGLTREIHYDDGISATELFPRREDVDVSNRTRMNVIGGEERIYRASEGGTLAKTEQGARLLANFMAPQTLTLKVGAQVMLIKNMENTLVNGSMGTVLDFVDPIAYSADPANEDDIAEKPSASGSNKTPHATVISKWPLVQFPNGRRVLIQPETFKIELPSGEIQVSRTQLPLILAWAMSIHKSQGQTLERVKVNLAKVFEKGQAYVALSRATSLDGLQVLHFDANKVKAHPKVVEWCNKLATISD